MSSVILTNWTVYYADDAAAGAGMKQIKWTGTTGTTTVNALYTALMDLFDNASQNNYFDSIPVKALTPTLYEIGSFDAGDRQPWFIDPDSIHHLTGAGLNTTKWSRDLTTRTASHGVYKLTRSTSNILAGDIGRTFTTSGTATGWILHVSGTAIWVRPTDHTSTHDLGAITSITTDGKTDTITARVTDESIWSNIYTLGTLQSNTDIYVYQNGSLLTKWWSDGHLDALIATTDFGTLIDSGNLTIYARQYTTLYDHFGVNVSAGGRTPIPIATFADNNNTTGSHAFDFDAGTGAFVVGEIIYSGTKRGVITTVTQANPLGRIEYYLLHPYTQFTDNDAITGTNSGATGLVNEPTAIETLVAGYTDITLTFGSITRDLNNGNGLEPYDIEIDCNNRPLTQVYEYLKYLNRSGSTTSLGGTNGAAYISANPSYDPVKAAPFGTLAGGRFFGARGVWLKNVPALDGNNYELIDSNGVRQVPPISIAITINGVNIGDTVSVFRTTGNNESIDRTIYTSTATGNNLGDPDFVVQQTIAADTPASGVIRIVNNNVNDEDLYAYDSWAGSTFTLSSGITLIDTYTDADTAYVPYIQTTAAGTSVSQAVTYAADRYVLVVVRAAGTIPFKVAGQVTSTGLTITAIRTTDSIYQ
jgi:hypothetical protein